MGVCQEYQEYQKYSILGDYSGIFRAGRSREESGRYPGGVRERARKSNLSHVPRESGIREASGLSGASRNRERPKVIRERATQKRQK